MEDAVFWQGPSAEALPDEAGLVAAARRDPAVFTQLYHAYLARVYTYLRVRTPTPADAEDLTQQVFLQAWAALPEYHDRGVPFAAWLFRIARNLAVDSVRRA